MKQHKPDNFETLIFGKRKTDRTAQRRKRNRRVHSLCCRDL